MGFRDHFSGVAAAYAAYRPAYPEALFDWLVEAAPARRLVWDCACGSGQATMPLAERFARVVATDASLSQLLNVVSLDNGGCAAATAENAPLAGASVDLVTVGQALHWFDLRAFYAQVRRVLVPRGVVAAWTYGLPEIDDGSVEAVVRSFIDDTLGPFWPPEVALVLDGYVSLDFPFSELEPPLFEIAVSWTLPRFLAFVRTWSGVGRFFDKYRQDPVEELAAELGVLWREPESRRGIRWRLKTRVGRV